MQCTTDTMHLAWRLQSMLASQMSGNWHGASMLATSVQVHEHDSQALHSAIRAVSVCGFYCVSVTMQRCHCQPGGLLLNLEIHSWLESAMQCANATFDLLMSNLCLILRHNYAWTCLANSLPNARLCNTSVQWSEAFALLVVEACALSFRV